MQRYLVASLAAVFIASAAHADTEGPQQLTGQATTTAAVPASEKLSDIKSIYVAPLGSSDESELIRQKIINRLIKSGVVNVTESAEGADAVLTGASETSSRHHINGNFNSYGGYVSGGTRYSADCTVRLISKNKQVLWASETGSRFFAAPHSAGGAASSVAGRLVDHLVADIKRSALAEASKSQ